MSEMDKIHQTCPMCTCPHWNQTGYSTADAGSAWRDTDGKWYSGPAHEDMTRRCQSCGWTQCIKRERGKLVKVDSDRIT